LAEQAAAGPKAAPRSAYAESVLMLRTAVLYAAPQGFRTLSVTSAQPQEGKSVLAANLGVALALHGAKTLLMDTDIRRPTLHRLFEMNNALGLANVLRQTTPLEECFRATTVERLYVMPAGPALANPGELLATMLPQVLAALTAEFDYVILDSPPVLGFADAVSVATAVETTLLVARAGKTPREVVQAALQPLLRVRARVLGLVLNQVSSSLSPYYSYYHDHYARAYSERELAAGEDGA
jgi:capsular exopolysaccharide synthesis family protein